MQPDPSKFNALMDAIVKLPEYHDARVLAFDLVLVHAQKDGGGDRVVCHWGGSNENMQPTDADNREVLRVRLLGLESLATHRRSRGP